MMDEKQKQQAQARLSRIEGQVRGIQRMIDEDRYCIDVLTQTRSIAAALRGVEDLIMEQHLQTCVADAMKSDNDGEKKEKVDEIMETISKFRKHG